MTTAEIAQRLDAKRSGNGWTAKCPAHEDSTPSLSITEGDDGRTLLNCHAGCSFESILAAAHLTPADCFPPKPQPVAATPRKLVATYPYHDASGKLLFEAVRYEPKDFRQRRPDGAGNWIYSVKDVRPVPYRLPELLKAVAAGNPVFVCEGEKDCDAMRRAGLVATCNAGGAGKWKPEFAAHFNGALVCVVADKDAPGRKHAQQVAANLQPVASRVSVIELPGATVKDAADFLNAGGQAGDILTLASEAPAWTQAQLSKLDSSLSDRLAKRIFNFAVIPPPIVPRYSIGETPVSTPGNLTAISAAVKSGKSSFIGAMMSATMANANADCLGVRSANEEGFAVIHLDTEQAIEDHDALGRRIIRRSGITTPPPWFLSYCVTGFSVPDSQEALRLLMREAATKFGGIHSVLCDGVADMVPDVNDAETCNAFVGELHALAIQYACPIVGVIHLNPNGEKTRGHLGSQLERKAETNLRLERDGDAIVCWSDKNRRAPISKSRGPRFVWSDEFAMHISAEAQGSAKAKAELQEMKAEAQAVFTAAGQSTVSYGQFITLLEREGSMSKSSAKRRRVQMSDAGVITKELTGFYTLNA